MSRISKGVVVGLVGLALGLVGVRAADESASAKQAGKEAAAAPKSDFVAAVEIERAAAAKIREAMQTKVKLEFEETPLNDALKNLAERGKLNLWIYRESLDDANIHIDEPITIRFDGQTIEQVLNRMLEPLQLTWVIEAEVLKITTVEIAYDTLFTRVYNVKNLLAKAKQFEGRKTSQVHRGQRLMFVQFGGGGQAVGGGFGGNHGTGVGPGSWLDYAIQTLTTGTWEEIDGNGGTIDSANHLLVIRQTRAIHDNIAGLLKAFTAFVDGELKLGSTGARRPNYPFANDAAVHKALRAKIDVAYAETPLKDVVEHLQDQLKMQFFVYEESLDDAGIAIDEPVTFTMKGITARSVLKLILEPLQLVAYVDEGSVTITTEEIEQEKRIAAVYDVSDLSKAGIDGNSLIRAVQNETSGLWEDIDGDGGKVEVPIVGMLAVVQTHQIHAEIATLLADMRKHLSEDKTEPVKDDPDKIVTRFYPTFGKEMATGLEKAISTFIAPDTWKAKDGNGTILLIGTTLAIRQTAKVHEQIKKFLKEFNEAEQKALQQPAPGGGRLGGGGLGGGGFF